MADKQTAENKFLKNRVALHWPQAVGAVTKKLAAVLVLSCLGLAGVLFLPGAAQAADVSTRFLSWIPKTLDSSTDAVTMGCYDKTWLPTVDADLAEGNIKSGVTVFGVTGTAAIFPPAPDAGGAWLLVPGDSALGTRDFWVQKYEARNESGVAVSTPSGSPWVLVTQTTATLRCEALGPGYHLLTMPEALTISRNIENRGWNWTDGSVGSGGLWRGHSDGTPVNSLAADVTGDPDDDYYIGTGQSGTSIERRVHQLSTGEYIWDWSGNVWEWVNITCTPGAGAGFWYNSGVVIEWDNANLSDYEKVRAGPAGAYTATQNAGQYNGCNATGNAVIRGGHWGNYEYAGLYAFLANSSPLVAYESIGFRCGR